MKKWCELSLKGDETASKIIFRKVDMNAKFKMMVYQLCIDAL